MDKKIEELKGIVKEHKKKKEHEGSKKTETKKPKIDLKQQKINELTETLQRLQAEFENYKKRIDKEKGEYAKYAAANLISKLLPALDSIEHALKNKADKEKFAHGSELIFKQLKSVLENEGLRPIEAKGRIDPYKHEVLLKEASEKEEDTIIEELQKGYMFKDKVLRHAKVKVAKKDDKKEHTAKQDTGARKDLSKEK